MSKSEKLQSAIAIFIAMMALFISLWQGCEQRKHNRLSVRPLLTFDVFSRNQTKSIRLSNDGLGPALIKRFMITIDGEKLDAEKGNPWTAVLDKRLLRNRFSEMYYFAEGTTVKADRSFNLFTWEPDSVQQLGIRILIDYQSIYEEKFSIEEGF